MVNGVIVDMTPEEIAQRQEEESQWLIEKADIEAKKQAELAAQESAVSKLTALGLTADEVKALLGVK
jgi:sugar-specific transcriptional regulator TrmB